MKQVLLKIDENKMIARGIFKMVLRGDTTGLGRPGQFVNLKLDGFYLRRPISVCDVEGDSLTLIYRVVGGGTEKMSRMLPGELLDVLTGLGNGYDTLVSGERPLLIGGGVGVPPLYLLAKRLVEEGKHPSAILGFGTGDEVFLENELAALGVSVTVTTADGSRGEQGFVTDVMNNIDYTYFYACGPEPMFRAVERIAKTSGQYSFEERMGCGFGACMGCSCKTLTGNKRICREGPVMRREEILWED